MKCKVCGQELNDHSNFCSNCGVKVRNKNNRNNDIEEFFESENKIVDNKNSNNIFEAIILFIIGLFKVLFNCFKWVFLFLIFFLYDLVKHSK